MGVLCLEIYSKHNTEPGEVGAECASAHALQACGQGWVLTN